jgi:hypothetical protein
MKRPLVLAGFIVAALAGSAAPASAVIHVTVPADDCAPAHAQAVSNDRFEEQIAALAGQGRVTLPLGGFKNAPTSCPAD